MNKRERDPRRKLVIERRTLRTLDARDLGQVAGGARKQDGDDGGGLGVVGDIWISRARGTV